MKPFLIALPLLVLLLVFRFHAQHAVATGWEFSADGAYLSQEVAQNLASRHVYGVGDGRAIPALRESLWRVILSVIGRVISNPALGAIALGSMSAVVALWFACRFARRFHEPNVIASAVVIVLGAAWPAAALSGDSVALGAACVVAAVWIYARGYGQQEEFLPLSAAALLGVASLLHLEFAAVWLVLWAHALIWVAVQRVENGLRAAIFRGLSGVLLITLIISPIIAWNMKTLGVPFPRIPGVSPIPVGGSSIAIAFDKLNEFSCLNMLALRAAFWIGLAMLLVDFVKDRRQWAFGLVISLYLLTPVVHGALAPALGWNGAHALYSALNVVWLLTMAYGAYAMGRWLVRGVSVIAKDRMPLWAPVALLQIPTSVVIVILLGWELHSARAAREDLKTATSARASLASALAGESQGSGVATDQPGWMIHKTGLNVLDLTGETTVPVLALVNSSGGLDPAGLTQLIRQEKAGLLVLWGSQNEDLKSLPGVQPIEAGEGTPFIARVMTSAIP